MKLFFAEKVDGTARVFNTRYLVGISGYSVGGVKQKGKCCFHTDPSSDGVGRHYIKGSLKSWIKRLGVLE